MSDAEATTPRVFIARHGKPPMILCRVPCHSASHTDTMPRRTEWAKIGRFTGITDIELTEHGIKQVSTTAAQLVGRGKLLDPSKVAHICVSPRKRAQQTYEILFAGGEPAIEGQRVTVTEDIAEWGYGDYEGLKAEEIRATRKAKGLDQDKPWDMWRDGCEGGESAQDVCTRLDRLISQIRDVQRPCMTGEGHADVVVVAHGAILRAFVKRWLHFPLDMPLNLMFEPGAIGVLSYKNNNIRQPALLVGMALPP